MANKLTYSQYFLIKQLISGKRLKETLRPNGKFHTPNTACTMVARMLKKHKCNSKEQLIYNLTREGLI